MLIENKKRTLLSEFVDEKAVEELLIYSKNKFERSERESIFSDVRVWESYIEESKSLGVYPTLQKYLVQFQFPISKDISSTDEYKNVTLKGRNRTENNFLQLDDPKSLELELYDNFLVERVPVLTVKNNNDFVKIIQALSYKNEPHSIPQSMGGACIRGINNWDRVKRLKKCWLHKGNNIMNWSNYFKNEIIKNPYLYRDTIIVLSKKPYSGILHHQLKLDKNTWKSNSTIIRLNHELAHLFTLKEYGTMNNNMHDEIVADYAGIIKVRNEFRKDWMLTFMGLEEYPKYRKGGRLENYLGNNGMSNEVFKGLQNVVYKVIDTIDKFEKELGNPLSDFDKKRRIKTLCEVDLITMSSKIGVEELLNVYRRTKA